MLRFFRMALLSFRALFAWIDPKLYLVINVVDPLLQILYYGLLVRYTHGARDLAPWIVGNALLLCTRNAVFVVGSLLRNERYEGTLMLTVASPANKFKVFVARSFFNPLEAALSVILGLGFGMLVFGARVPPGGLGPLALILAAAMFAGMCFGLVLSSLALVMREVHLFLNVAAMLLFILTGASFPLERLPAFALQAAHWIPVTRSVAASRLLFQDPGASIAPLLLQEFLLSLLYLLTAYGLFRFFERVARVNGTLECY